MDAPPNPLRGLTSDSAYLASYLKTISGPIVLVGHSYGGAVITNAAPTFLGAQALRPRSVAQQTGHSQSSSG